MAIPVPPEIVFTARDFDSILAFLKNIVRSGDRPELWTDFFDSNIGMKIMYMIAGDGAVGSFVMNMTQQEMFLATCKIYESALAHAKTCGYKPRRKTSASLTLTGRQPLPRILATTDLIFKAGTTVSVGNQTFQLIYDAIFVAGTVPTYAKGTVRLLSNPLDGETVTLYDGCTRSVFEFDDNGTYGTGNIPVDIGAVIADTISNFAVAVTDDADLMITGGIATHLTAVTAFTVSEDGVRIFSYSESETDQTVLLTAQPSDGDTVTLNNGTTSSTFEFDDGGGVIPGNIAVLIGANVVETNTNLVDAINVTPLLITASGVGDTSNLIHDYAMKLGNQPIEKSGSSITVSGMSGGDTVELTVSNSMSHVDTFTSSGTAFQNFTTTISDVLKDSWTVKVGNIEWTEVPYVLLAQAEEVYQTSLDGDGNLTISFGDGNTGNIPGLGRTVTVSYRTGGGSAGAIISHGADGAQVVGFFGANSVKLVFDNYFPSSGWSDAETTDEMRIDIPAWIRTVDKVIADEDYDSQSSDFSDPDFGSVALAYTELHNSNGGATPPTDPNINRVDTFIWTRSGTTYAAPSEGLKRALYAYLHSRRCTCTQSWIMDGKLHDVDLDLGTVTIDTRYDLVAMQTAIDNAIDAFFTRDTFGPGDTFYVSQFYNAIIAVPGVIHFELALPATDVTPTSKQWMVVKGTVTMTLQYP